MYENIQHQEHLLIPLYFSNLLKVTLNHDHEL